VKKKTPMVLAQLLLFTSLCVSAVPCFAGMQQGFITSLFIRASDGLVYFYLNGTPKERPSCAKALKYWMIQDENSTAGKQQLAQLLTAYASGKTLIVYGTNTCTRWPDGEDVDIIVIE
jgi:hypothetical protein